MAVTWGSTQGYLRVGIDITQSPSSVGTGTTSVTLTIRFYVQSQSYGFSDNQTLTVTGSVSGTYNYTMSSGYGQTKSILVATRTLTVPTSYAGNVRRSFAASVSGNNATGSSPSHSRIWDVARRPPARPDKMATPSVSNITSSGFRVTWSAPDNNGASIQRYHIQIATNSAFSNIVYANSSLTGGALNSSGRNRDTTYYIRVRAFNSAGWGDWSNTRSVTTLATEPDTPNAPSITDIAPDKMTFNWNTPNNGGSGIQNYTLQVSKTSNFSSGVQTYTVAAISRTVTGLDPGVRYYARVRANNAIGSGNYSSTSSADTVAGALVKINGIWRSAAAWVKVSGSWRVAKIYKKVNGSWVI